MLNIYKKYLIYLNKTIGFKFIQEGLFVILLSLPSLIYSQSDTTETHLEPDTIHTAKKATLFSIILPGSGQIYNNFHRPETQKNRLWWKLPIIYGGLGTSAYFIINNQKSFHHFRDQRLALLNGDNTILYSDQQLASIEDQYRKWRDMSVIAALAVYVLNIIDANVEGTLLHFDDSDNLSINISPYFQPQLKTFAGAKLSINF